MKQIEDHTNEVYGKLKVIEFVERKNRKTYWKCQCDCGNEIILPITYLTTGDTKSCGCLRKEISAKTQHKKAFVKNKRLYAIWIDMRRRCYNDKRSNYVYYGAKGINICDEWKNDFKKFQEWSFKNGYTDDFTIDRINNKKGYEPDNCRWITTFEQNNNMTTNHKIEYKGKIYNSMSSFCREKQIDYNKFRQKIREGYNIQVALNFCKN